MEELLILDSIVKAMYKLPIEARQRTFDYLNARFPVPSQDETLDDGFRRYGPGPFDVGLYETPRTIRQRFER